MKTTKKTVKKTIKKPKKKKNTLKSVVKKKRYVLPTKTKGEYSISIGKDKTSGGRRFPSEKRKSGNHIKLAYKLKF